MFAIFTEVPADDIVARNGDLRRKQWLQLGMIWVFYTSKHHPKPMVTLGYVKVIRGHGIKLVILIIWHRNTHSLVSFSSRTRKITLEHPLLHLNRNISRKRKSFRMHRNVMKSGHFGPYKSLTRHFWRYQLEIGNVCLSIGILSQTFRFLEMLYFL